MPPFSLTCRRHFFPPTLRISELSIRTREPKSVALPALSNDAPLEEAFCHPPQFFVYIFLYIYIYICMYGLIDSHSINHFFSHKEGILLSIM